MVIVLQGVSAKRCPPGTVGCKKDCVDGGKDKNADESCKYCASNYRSTLPAWFLSHRNLK